MLLEAARDYFTRGWTAIPLTNDAEGRPKRPFSDGWQRTPHDWDAIADLPWEQAIGLGLVLGTASSNLAAIDIDDVELAEAVFRLIEASPIEHYFVSTYRKRGHLYLTERIASNSSRFEIDYHDRKVTIELKGNGTQVAAPPTPGYALRASAGPALVHDGMTGAWGAIAGALGLQVASRGYLSSGYPQAWAQQVSEGDRNNTLYVEACRLAEAGMPLFSAVETMQARAQVAFAGKMPSIEVERTVRSAYRKAHKPMKGWMR